jgi:hypothetical protein
MYLKNSKEEVKKQMGICFYGVGIALIGEAKEIIRCSIR